MSKSGHPAFRPNGHILGICDLPTTPKPIPKTGDASIPAAIFAGMGIVSLCAIAGAKRLRAREDAEISISRGEPRGGEKR